MQRHQQILPLRLSELLSNHGGSLLQEGIQSGFVDINIGKHAKAGHLTNGQ